MHGVVGRARTDQAAIAAARSGAWTRLPPPRSLSGGRQESIPSAGSVPGLSVRDPFAFMGGESSPPPSPGHIACGAWEGFGVRDFPTGATPRRHRVWGTVPASDASRGTLGPERVPTGLPNGPLSRRPVPTAVPHLISPDEWGTATRPSPAEPRPAARAARGGAGGVGNVPTSLVTQRRADPGESPARRAGRPGVGRAPPATALDPQSALAGKSGGGRSRRRP